MLDRYLHMFSWGVLYATFSLCLVSLYRTLQNSETVLYLSRNNGKKKPLLHSSDAIIYLIMTIVSAIRLNTGSDFYNYYTYFDQILIRYNSFEEVFFQSQSGYFALSYIIKQITDYQYAIFAVIAVFSYAYLFYLIRSEVEDTTSALLTYMFLGYYAYSNNILKQYIAMNFVMATYLALSRRKYFKTILFAVGAMLFHYSSVLVLVILFFASRFKPTFNKYYLAIVGGLVVALNLNTLFAIFFKLIPSASGYEIYVNWRRSDQIRLVLAVLGMAIMHGILIYYILKYKDKIKKQDERRYREIIFLIIGLAINILSIRQWIINRIAVYFYQFIILILPTMFSSLEVENKKRLKIVLYIIMFIYMIFISIFLGENEYFSYNTIFSGDQPISDVIYNQIHGWTK
ncbi:EpsG family protein [Streptococcus suis]|uniref:EpsG family protein n=1 Tax=Streptococcus suis TaxID=1307 RepID=UPI000CF42401|nr:EpsG family protein [Streptococcus suis]